MAGRLARSLDSLDAVCGWAVYKLARAAQDAVVGLSVAMFSFYLERVIGSRLVALVTKETREILRNKYLLFLLLVPPVVQLLILSAALDPNVRNLHLGVADRDNSTESHNLRKALDKSPLFSTMTRFTDERLIDRQLERGQLSVGVVIPENYSEKIKMKESPSVQVLVDGADAFTSGIATSDIVERIYKHKPQSTIQNLPPIEPKDDVLYNPDRLATWFFVPNVLGATLTLTATLVASAAILRERESGTIEQLLMTPAASWEVLLAKIIPLVLFLLGSVAVAMFSTRVIFGLPFRGDPFLFIFATVLYILAGISVGMLLGSLCRSQRQAQLASFFINIPLILLSGTVVPADSLPTLLRWLSQIDPLRYYGIIILKGVGINELWPNLVVLSVFSALLLCLIAFRFRRQLV
jgi:ABC-2 type transport system permease protein